MEMLLYDLVDLQVQKVIQAQLLFVVVQKLQAYLPVPRTVVFLLYHQASDGT